MTAQMTGALPLSGRVALVTGASRGIGAEIAPALAAAGADVACAGTSARNAEPTAEAVRALGRRALALSMRVERAEEVAAAFERTEQELGPVTVLVNNAGISRPTPILEMEEEVWDAVVDTNLKGVFLCARRAAHTMKEQGGGTIINIGSIAGQNAFPMRSNYCASKAAVHHLTRVMAVEWAELGIRVNCVAPGYIESDITRTLSSQGLLDIGALEGRIPQRRLGQPRDIADAVVYLAGDSAGYVTGSVLLVDGGWDAYGFV